MTTMCLIFSLLLGVLLSLVDSKGTYYGGHVGHINPFFGNRYNMYKAGLNPQLTPNKPMTRHKNHCAYVVQKNITCTMQDGVSTYVKAEYTTKCIWGQKCPVVLYRTFYKPKYKIGYKTVTELEWRCCPGYSGDNCFDGPTSQPDVVMPPFKGAALPHRPGIKGFPHGPKPPVDQKPGEGQLEPGPSRPIPIGELPSGESKFGISGVTGERLDRMEEDLRRLTQGLDTLNGVVAGLEERLRTTLREDTNKLLVSLLPVAPRNPDSSVGFGSLPDGTPDGLDGGETFNGFGDLAGRVTEVRDELRAKTHIIEEIQVNSLSQRVLLLEESVKGLTDSQLQLQTSLMDQSVHVESMIETRLLDVVSHFNSTQGGSMAGIPGGLDGFKNLLEDKLKTLEERVFVAVEELSNATAPALLEGKVVPALETDMESMRRKFEGDMARIEKQLVDLELLCTSSCIPSTPSVGGVTNTEVEEECGEMEKKMADRLDTQSNQLDYLNNTLQNLLFRIAQEDSEGSVYGEITLLKVNINSVNRTLKGLKDSISYIASEVGHVNSTWEQRENQLVNQVQGITKLVGRQASLLGAGERRLAQLKGELAALKKRLAGELHGCHSTAIEVQKEVKAVDSRVTQVEGQCSSLGELAEQLERIRAELERHSDTYLRQVNGTNAVKLIEATAEGENQK
ncbi:EMILIN-3 isoform X2 [Synchiropus splendidus]|uniref:EMILIN-3 isoform X2 n=1 Tax=Synchiropus splendidus TaxID=270530 RepID=UPI00237E4CBF|nr:EMILIN-3 isoform X2 [Synchiropus splendidus]